MDGSASSFQINSVAMQQRAVKTLPNEILRSILRFSLRLDACYKEQPPETTPEDVIREVASHARMALIGPKSDNFTRTQLIFEGWQKKDHISARNKRIVTLYTTPLAVSLRWLEVGKSILLHDNGFVEISTNDSTFGYQARWFGLQVWTLGSHSSYPDSIVRIYIRPNDEDSWRNESSPVHQYTHLVNIEDIDQLGRFLMCKKLEFTHSMIKSTEYEGRCFRIHVNREKYNGVCTHLDAFEKLLFNPFIAGLMESISSVTVSQQLRSYADMIVKLATSQTRSAMYLMKHNHDLLGPGYLLSQLAERFEIVKHDTKHHRPEGVLLRILEFATSILGCRAGDLHLRPSDSSHGATRYLTEMTRIAAYRLARIMVVLVMEKGGSKIFRTECMWKALRLLQLAVLIPTANPASQRRWKALCYFQLMRVYGFVGATQRPKDSDRRSLECFVKALDYAGQLVVGGDVIPKWLLIQNAQTFRDEYVETNVNGPSRWRWDPIFREGFFQGLAKAGAVPLLASCWSDADEAVFPKMDEFYED